MSGAPDLGQRYGRPSPSRRRAIIAVSGIVGVIGLGWVLWAAYIQSTPQVQSTLRTFDVVDSHTVEATVSVKARSDGVRASCVVSARARDHSVVGELSFAVRGTDGTTNHSVTLRTEREAAAVELEGCTAKGQDRPR